jgi:RNA polymerase sigma-70 factor (ECF subfamily)
MIRPYLKPLFALAWRFTHNTALAQDLVQDTMLKAYRFFHRFETGTNFWAWLATIMRNLYFSQVRRQSREAIVMDIDHFPLPDSPGEDDPSLTPLDALDGVLPHLVTDDVLEALDHLPDDYRTTVLLADMLEYSYKDIARAMDCPMGTVMSRLHRGRQMLQTRLRQYAIEQGYISKHEAGISTEHGSTTAGLRQELICA